MDRHLLVLRGYSIAFVELRLPVTLPVHSAHTAASSEVLVGHDSFVGLDIHRDTGVGESANNFPYLVHKAPHLL